MKSAGKARSNGLYRHIRTSKEIIRNLLNDSCLNIKYLPVKIVWLFSVSLGKMHFFMQARFLLIRLRRKAWKKFCSCAIIIATVNWGNNAANDTA